jgi:predicted  nucleic acid-binding Zn-ribbon protein
MNQDKLKEDAFESLKIEREVSEIELDKFCTVLQITQEALESAEHELLGLRNELSKSKSKIFETESILGAPLKSSCMSEISELPRELSLLLKKLGFASLGDANSFLERCDSRVACSLDYLIQSFLEVEAKLGKTESELKEARNEASQLTHCLTLTSGLSANEYQNLTVQYNQLVLDKEELHRSLISMQALLAKKTEKNADLQSQLKMTEQAKTFAEEAIEHRESEISVLCDEIKQLKNSNEFNNPS